MFIRSVTALALLSASVFAGPAAAIAAPTTASPSSGACSGLASAYDGVEKSLALTYAEGVGDNSAARETNRQMENANDLAKASMILTLMQAHHCAMPNHAPSMATYISSALTCATDRLKGVSDAPSCKMDTWQPIK